MPGSAASGGHRASPSSMPAPPASGTPSGGQHQGQYPEPNPEAAYYADSSSECESDAGPSSELGDMPSPRRGVYNTHRNRRATHREQGNRPRRGARPTGSDEELGNQADNTPDSEDSEDDSTPARSRAPSPEG